MVSHQGMTHLGIELVAHPLRNKYGNHHKHILVIISLKYGFRNKCFIVVDIMYIRYHVAHKKTGKFVMAIEKHIII